MKLYTEVDIEALDKKITYKDNILFVGSCFAQNIGQKFQNYKYNAMVNPTGILYNPISIATSFYNALNQKNYQASQLHEKDYFFSFDFHSSFATSSAEESLALMHKGLKSLEKQCHEAEYIFITFGTAWIYELDGEVVANCHKTPISEFTRRRISVNEIIDVWSKLIERLCLINKKVEIIFTVSPIRHWKDGANENQLSKSTLLLAIDEIVKCFNNVQYFPAYEILIDELRDYRFYKEDMIHPNALAVDYIWDKIKFFALSPDTLIWHPKWENLLKQINHQPKDSKSLKHMEFLKSLLKKLEDFQLQSQINVNQEIQEVRQRLF